MARLIKGVSKNHVYAEIKSAFFNEKKHKKSGVKINMKVQFSGVP